jgi:hypothetical protein
MKAVERRRKEVLLREWTRILRDLNDMGPASDSYDDLMGFAEVKDYLLDRIAAVEDVLHNARSSRRLVNSLPPKDNALDNPLRPGVDNA